MKVYKKILKYTFDDGVEYANNQGRYDKKYTYRCYDMLLDAEKKILVDFFKFFQANGERLIGISIEELVQTYLDARDKNAKD